MSTPIEIARGRLFAAEEAAPYLATALWTLTFHPVEGMYEKANAYMGVDQWWRVYYDPRCLALWTKIAFATGLIHELGHVLRDHAGRRGSRDPVLWNLASDGAVNDDIQSPLALLDSDFHPTKAGLPTGQTEDFYYDKLKASQKTYKLKCCGSGADGVTKEWELQGEDGESVKVSPEQAEMIRKKVAEDIKECKERGEVPGGWQRWADATLNPQVPWQTLLMRHVRRAGQVRAGSTDYTYSRRARRQLPSVILPRMVARTPRLAAVVDTSGSMANRQIGLALGEVQGIGRACGDGTAVFFVDAAVAGRTTAGHVGRGARGGGGTDMRVGIRAALADKPRPDVVVVLTDGYTPWPEAKPGCEVIACLTASAGGRVGIPDWIRVVEVR